MSKRRDRHLRGLRGPMATPSPLTGVVVPLRRRETNAAFFVGCVREAVARVQRDCPRALTGIDVGLDEVPVITSNWTTDRVPLAAAMEPTEDAPGQVVLYRRPLERRAATRRGLAILVYRTLVEQLAVLTGLDVATIDPGGRSEEDDD